MSRTAAVKHPDKFYVDGGWIAPSGRDSIDVFDAATEELFGRFAAASEADIVRAVEAARRAFDEGPWPRMSPAERAKYLNAIGEETAKRSAEIADSFCCEAGMTAYWAQMMAGGVGGVYSKFASMAETFPFVERRMTERGGNGILVHEPVGVVAAIVPWNGPATGIAHKVAPALLAGCTVVLKVSPEAPTTGWILAEACEKAGLPPGVVNVVNADREVSESLVRNPAVDMVNFTGSTATGRRIGVICAERVARVQLELGGKSPAVILEDFDLGQAAQTLGMAARMLTGQVCASITRLVVSAHRHDEFVDALTAVFGSTKVGDPFADGIEMGPLAFDRQRQRVEGYIAKGKAEGARLTTGGGRPRDLNRGYFVEPTIFANCDNSMTIAKEEIFGPVLCVIPAKDEADAIRIANDTVYGLKATVFTNDLEKAWTTARRIRSGTVGHNFPMVDFNLGFGGFKQSGIGRQGHSISVMACTEPKAVILGNWPADVADAPMTEG